MTDVDPNDTVVLYVRRYLNPTNREQGVKTLRTRSDYDTFLRDTAANAQGFPKRMVLLWETNFVKNLNANPAVIGTILSQQLVFPSCVGVLADTKPGVVAPPVLFYDKEERLRVHKDTLKFYETHDVPLLRSSMLDTWIRLRFTLPGSQLLTQAAFDELWQKEIELGPKKRLLTSASPMPGSVVAASPVPTAAPLKKIRQVSPMSAVAVAVPAPPAIPSPSPRVEKRMRRESPTAAKIPGTDIAHPAAFPVSAAATCVDLAETKGDEEESVPPTLRTPYGHIRYMRATSKAPLSTILATKPAVPFSTSDPIIGSLVSGLLRGDGLLEADTMDLIIARAAEDAVAFQPRMVDRDGVLTLPIPYKSFLVAGNVQGSELDLDTSLKGADVARIYESSNLASDDPRTRRLLRRDSWDVAVQRYTAGKTTILLAPFLGSKLGSSGHWRLAGVAFKGDKNTVQPIVANTMWDNGSPTIASDVLALHAKAVLAQRGVPEPGVDPIMVSNRALIYQTNAKLCGPAVAATILANVGVVDLNNAWHEPVIPMDVCQKDEVAIRRFLRQYILSAQAMIQEVLQSAAGVEPNRRAV